MGPPSHCPSLPDSICNHMHPLYINDDDLDEDMQIAAMEQGSHPHPPTWRCHAPPGALTTVVWSGFYSNIGVSGVLERKAV